MGLEAVRGLSGLQDFGCQTTFLEDLFAHINLVEPHNPGTTDEGEVLLGAKYQKQIYTL